MPQSYYWGVSILFSQLQEGFGQPSESSISPEDGSWCSFSSDLPWFQNSLLMSSLSEINIDIVLSLISPSESIAGLKTIYLLNAQLRTFLTAPISLPFSDNLINGKSKVEVWLCQKCLRVVYLITSVRDYDSEKSDS